jgi:hypothetical protein
MSNVIYIDFKRASDFKETYEEVKMNLLLEKMSLTEYIDYLNSKYDYDVRGKTIKELNENGISHEEFIRLTVKAVYKN